MQDFPGSIQPSSNAGAVAPIDTVAAFTVLAFCRAHGISKASFYVYRKKGLGPVTMQICGRTLVSAESARAWREKMTEPSTLPGGAHV